LSRSPTCPVAWIERSEIRDRLINVATPSRVSLTLNPGYGEGGGFADTAFRAASRLPRAKRRAAGAPVF